MPRLAIAGAVAAATLSILTGVAGASTFTVGSTVEPSGASAQACLSTGLFAQSAGDAPTLYTLPAGGQITQWQTNTAGDTAGAAVALVALTPEAGGVYRVDAVDHETVPNPAGAVATFTPASPMMVSTGDILGIGGGSGVTCYWSGGSTPLDDVGDIFGALSEDPGDAFSTLGSGPFAVNVAATLVATEDSAVTTTVEPGSIAAGGAALLASTVTDHGPASNPLTFTDALPAGLALDAALSPSGPCTTLGQVVTCTISGLASGQSAPVDIVVTVPAGSYTNSVTVSQASGVTDPVTANNAATAKFSAPEPAVAKCVVTNLAGVPLGTAKKLLTDLSCKVGKVTKSYSTKVVKGDVVKTTPGSGSYSAKKSVAIVESKGPKPKKHKKKK
jgi:Domain of unknown function DUF11/PASTA domain